MISSLHKVVELKLKILFGYNFFSGGRREFILFLKMYLQIYLCYKEEVFTAEMS